MTTLIATSEDTADVRWREWQARCAAREARTGARLKNTVLVVVSIAAIGLAILAG